MTIDDFRRSKDTSRLPVAELVMSLARKATTAEFALLSQAFPHIIVEYVARLNAPRGELESDGDQLLET